MKKLLVGTAAVALGLSMTAPANAQDGVKLGVGGHMKGYVTWSDQDTNLDQDGVANDGTALAAGDEADDDANKFDILRETELHFSGETTLDNGLTVGGHFEVDIDGTDDNFTDSDAEEAYAYFSGAWGRFNMGKEDGAAYLLQVAAPSADANIDGLRQYVQPINFSTGSPTTNLNNATGAPNAPGTPGTDGYFGFNTTFRDAAGAGANNDYFDVDNSGGVTAGDVVIADNAEYNGGVAGAPNNPLVGNSLVSLINGFARYDYDQAPATYDNKLTYMTPVFNGFQAGVTYTPEVGGNSRSLDGTSQDDVIGQLYNDAWEISGRYEGQFDEVGVTFGGAYSNVNLEDDTLNDQDTDGNISDGVVAVIDNDGSRTVTAGDTGIRLNDREAWNVGLDLDWGPFGLGGAYLNDEAGFDGAFEADTWVVGIDYTTGPFKLGANYYDQDRDFFDVDEIETNRYSGGVTYTYGPGMTFRGSINYTDIEMPTFGDTTVANQDATNQDQEATSILLGTQINF